VAGLGAGDPTEGIFSPTAGVMMFGLPGGNFTAPFASNFIIHRDRNDNGLTTNVTFNGNNL